MVHINQKTSGRTDHSVRMVWPSLDSLSTTRLSRPGICQALRTLWCCLLLHERSCLSRTLSGPRRAPLVPDSLYAACFLEGTKFPLQYFPKRAPPPFFMVCKNLLSMTEGGVMVGLEKCFLPEATIYVSVE